jgi:hypothetical protein
VLGDLERGRCFHAATDQQTSLLISDATGSRRTKAAPDAIDAPKASVTVGPRMEIPQFVAVR